MSFFFISYNKTLRLKAPRLIERAFSVDYNINKVNNKIVKRFPVSMIPRKGSKEEARKVCSAFKGSCSHDNSKLEPRLIDNFESYKCKTNKKIHQEHLVKYFSG